MTCSENCLTKSLELRAKLKGSDAAILDARKSGDEKAIYKLLQAIRSAREQHRKQADALLRAEARVIQLEVDRGHLYTLCARSPAVQ